MAAVPDKKKEIICRLQRDILLRQGLRPSEDRAEGIGLGPVEEAFPGGVFPAVGVHEFISTSQEQAAASSGFFGGLLSALLRRGGVCLWVGAPGTVFPPALKTFGVEPDRIVFINPEREKDILWATEEALKCPGLAAVVAEVRDLDFVSSRRLQLAVEKSRVTGLVLRHDPRRMGATACAARWRIAPLPSVLEEGMPGVGFPRWQVELLKVRNGNPGSWQLEWAAGRFVPVFLPAKAPVFSAKEQKPGAGLPAAQEAERHPGLLATLQEKASGLPNKDRKTG